MRAGSDRLKGAMMDDVTGASITMRRTVAWNETDAAGHNHFSAAFRWMEEAEHQLYRCLGFSPEMVDRVPRVHIEIDYSARLYFGQLIDVHVGVVKVGSSSCTFAFWVSLPDGAIAMSGSYVIVHAASNSEGAAPWPDDLRGALSTPSAHLLQMVVD